VVKISGLLERSRRPLIIAQEFTFPVTLGWAIINIAKQSGKYG
jgi:hypothetical protein